MLLNLSNVSNVFVEKKYVTPVMVCLPNMVNLRQIKDVTIIGIKELKSSDAS